MRAEANLIWLCRAQPTINRINPPELNIRIYSIRLNTDVRQLPTYSPKGYTAVTVGVSPTACNKSNHEHPKWCYIRANNGHNSKQGSGLEQLKIKKVCPDAEALPSTIYKLQYCKNDKSGVMTCQQYRKTNTSYNVSSI